ncbi:MAG: c-type cytochrome [Terriglobia bacterium]
MRVKAAGSAVLIGLLGSGLLWAQGPKPWPVPAAAKKKKNPVAATPESIKLGAMLYRGNCFLCHGAQGKGNGPWAENLPAPPADFTARLTRSKMSDGELFWKISKGRDEMPRFEKQLSERQRWHLVNYLRTLARPPAAPSAQTRGR